ncbi:MAG: ATP-binding cassette domain-containing protein [Firmicutes bacterium]|nr:ATP-binding cassette domain-containing protein [Bacillota bacterium]
MLEVSALTIQYPSSPPISYPDFALQAGRAVILAGPTGAGKSSLAWALVGLSGESTRIRGILRFQGRSLLGEPESVWQKVRGRGIAVLFQDASRALHPFKPVGRQIQDALASSGLAVDAGQWLKRHGLDPAWAGAFPHQLSGGMAKAVLTALTLALRPLVLVADEPTLGLDLRHHQWMVETLDRYRREGGALLVLAHDGRGWEPLGAERLDLGATVGLDGSSPPGEPPLGLPTSPVLELRDVGKRYPGSAGRRSWACRGVTLSLARGERVMVVGDVGAGKSTVAKLAAGWVEPSEGEVLVGGLPWPPRRARERARVQLIAQEAVASLSPSRTVGELLEEPLAQSGRGDARWRRQEVLRWAERLELSGEHLRRRPTELSYGQCRRVGVLRALIAAPEVVVADEPMAGLDFGTRQKVARLLWEAGQKAGSALLWVEHDPGPWALAVHRLVVMYGGWVVEVGPAEQVYHAPRHPYTAALIQGRLGLGEPGAEESGCPWAPCCPRVRPDCRRAVPPLLPLSGERAVRCYHPLDPEG